jgi:hypothetical protein
MGYCALRLDLSGGDRRYTAARRRDAIFEPSTGAPPGVQESPTEPNRTHAYGMTLELGSIVRIADRIPHWVRRVHADEIARFRNP